MAVTVANIAQAEVTAQAIKALTGGIEPKTVYRKDYVELTFSPADSQKVRAIIEAKLKEAPGSVRLDSLPIIAPIVIKRAAPWAIVALIVAYLMGKGKIV